MLKLALAMATLLLFGCATGAVRQTRVAPLAQYDGVRAVRVVATEPDSQMAAELVAGARVGLPKAGWRMANDGEPAYTLELHIAEAQTPVAAEASSQRRRGMMPLRRKALELGQWTTVAPRSRIRRRSPASSRMPWPSRLRGPSRPKWS